VKFAVYQITRKGGRARNEDRMGYCYTRDAGLFAVADGMGGHPEGDVAAQLSLQTLSNRFQAEAKPRLADPQKFLESACLAGHRVLLRYAAEKGLTDNPRSTLVACVLQGTSAWWLHCGDSRLYLVRDGALVTRTVDHSYAEMHRHAADVVPLDHQVNRNVLFTCLGTPTKPFLDVTGPLELMPGDRLLLCSDGLWSNLSDDEIVGVLTEEPVSKAVPVLADRALKAGGARCDNVTLLAVEWEAPKGAKSDPGVSTRSLGEDVFASTIQAGEPSPDDDLDEEEIERSIREINEAIRRTARRS